MATGNNATIASASEALVECIKIHESAKTKYAQAVATLALADQSMRTACAFEVEAHEALRAEMVARRKARRR